MWLLEILKLQVAYIIFLMDSTAFHPLYMVELWLNVTVLCFLYFSNWKYKKQYCVFEKKQYISWVLELGKHVS